VGMPCANLNCHHGQAREAGGEPGPIAIVSPWVPDHRCAASGTTALAE
jgi:hypothetical protein